MYIYISIIVSPELLFPLFEFSLQSLGPDVHPLFEVTTDNLFCYEVYDTNYYIFYLLNDKMQTNENYPSIFDNCSSNRQRPDSGTDTISTQDGERE